MTVRREAAQTKKAIPDTGFQIPDGALQDNPGHSFVPAKLTLAQIGFPRACLQSGIGNPESGISTYDMIPA